MVSFMLFIITLAVIMSISNTETAEKDYYEKDLKYQNTINAREDYKKLKDKIKLEYKKDSKTITIQVPSNLKEAKGILYFIKPDDEKKDFKLPLKTDPQNRQEIDAAKLDKGLWKIEIELEIGDKIYRTDSWNLNL